MRIHKNSLKYFNLKKSLIKIKEKPKKLDTDYINKVNSLITKINKKIKSIKDKMYIELSKNTSIRTLQISSISNNRNVISVFDSTLTRVLNLKENQVSTDIIVVQAYYFNVLKDLILNGFTLNGQKYICFTASAGQIRTKKTVFIKEDLWSKHQNTLTCGLTIEDINMHGGVNVNKYLAYLALCNSATDDWIDFDINKVIVVEDMETTVRSVVDFIDDKTYEIERKETDMLINHTDGCGMILPHISKKSFMVRMPWIKGLLVPFPFDKFIREENRKNPNHKVGIVTDIYGKKYDILRDRISIILTRSQFKMHKYFKSWNHYKENYIKYNCQTGICNKEEDKIGDAKLNYQMLQTLSDITDNELEVISEETRSRIFNIGRDRKTMLKVLGVTESNNNKNHIQQALEIYPELLNDTYSREIIKQVKKSIVREGRAGKIDINGKYTFICPDLYAFCQHLILSDNNPLGLLKDGEIYCKLYKDENKLDCLRSPHLYREHAVRKNVIDKEKSRWFITKGLYTSIHDAISKILMFDVDGDKALVCADKTIIKVAERNMQDIVPLQYNMAKAEAEMIDNASIYNGLITAYTGGNIGSISNNITKIWNSNNINLDVIKWLCMENNFVIDYAKTLYKPIRPNNKGKLISKYTKNKTPHFFIYAKDKLKNNVESTNNSAVNRLEKSIPNTTINFKSANLGKFDYRFLLSDKNAITELDDEIINKYNSLDQKSHFMINVENDKSNNIAHIYSEIKEVLFNINPDASYIADILVEHLYNHKKTSFKTTLWECFGNILVDNLKRNIDGEFGSTYNDFCEYCSERITATSNSKKYCDNCFKQRRLKQQREWDKIKRKREKSDK